MRAVRRSSELSQRQLANLAGVPRSTIDRIESGQANPRLTTLCSILAAAGYDLVICDGQGRPVVLDDAHDDLRDRAERRFPAHLRVCPVKFVDDGWWGWLRVAWHPSDPAVPSHTYHLRRRDFPFWWNDAT